MDILDAMQKNIDIEQADIIAVKQCFHDCQRKLLTKGYNVTNIPTWGLNVMFNLKGVTAGRAWKDKIKLNRELFVRNREDFFKSTIPHEFAHVVAYHLYPLDHGHHGPKWKQIMIALDLNPERCHGYDVTEVKRYKKPLERIEMGCACGVHRVTAIKYNRMLNGVSYRCVSCKQPLKRR